MRARTSPDLGVPDGRAHQVSDDAPRDVSTPALDPRAVRASLAPSAAAADLPPIVVEPPRPTASSADADGRGHVLVNGRAAAVELIRLDGARGILAHGGAGGSRKHVLLPPPTPALGAGGGVVRREVVVDGWTVAVDVEPATRAALRERATRGRREAGRSGPTDVRAIIPGVVIAVFVTEGDAVMAGQQLLAVEAMKMQNELRATRDGMIARVAVGAGETIEVGDLLLVLA